jgi:anti-anti-sigma factor
MANQPILNSMVTPYVFHLKARTLSAGSSPELLYWVNSILELGAKVLLVDFRDVLFMDSSGLGALVIARNRVQKMGGQLMLCSLNGQARMLFELSGMDQAFKVYDTVADCQRVLAAQEAT